MKLEDAQALSAHIRDLITPCVERVEVAGSIRREKLQVKDIELCVLEPSYEELFRVIPQFGYIIKPGTPQVIPWEARVGSKYIRIMTHEGIKLDMFVGTQENWGVLYTMRTGGATGPDGSAFSGFVPGLFKRWKKLSGGGMMKDCLPTYPDGSNVTCPEESDFFQLLNMKWVPPNERVSNKVIKGYVI
jgi:DNA polymerase/3'-5' exonuclease PolX